MSPSVVHRQVSGRCVATATATTEPITPAAIATHKIGESMIEDGIFDGDYVFVRKTPAANPGDIVVAMIEGEATVKRFFREKDRVRLHRRDRAKDRVRLHRAEF